VYAMDSTTECGSRPHSRTRAVPTARPCSRAPTAWIPQAATAAAVHDTTSPAAPPPSGVTVVTARTSPGYSGKNARSL